MEILYIEDDLIDQIALRRMFRHDKTIDCQIASDIPEAEKLIKNFKFDLILSDYHLAGDTIEDVMSRFKEFPVFLLSGTDNEHKIQALYENGLKGHFQKPFSKKDLLHLLHNKPTEIVVKKSEKDADFSLPIKFDFTFLEAAIKKSPDLRNEFIQIFINLGDTEVTRLRQSLKISDWYIIGQSTHKLKSNLRMMGLKQLLRKAGEIEMLCLEQIEEKKKLLKDLSKFIERLEKAIQVAKVELLKQPAV